MLALELHVKKNPSEVDKILAFLTGQGYAYAHLFKPRLMSKRKPEFVKIPLSELENYSAKNHKMVVFTFDWFFSAGDLTQSSVNLVNRSLNR